MRIVFTGGGTGGHIYPALAIAQHIVKIYPNTKILFVGTENGLEAEVVPRAGFEFAVVSSQGLQRKLTWSNFATLFKVLYGLWEAKRILKDFKPDLVVGTGGYVCGPVILMAHLLRIPTAIHEQNAFPGITNRLLARIVDLVMVNFAESISIFPRARKVKITGLPVRPEIIKADRIKGAQKLGLNPDLLTVLVVGGSRGARSINKAMLRVFEYYQQKDIQILHITGKNGYAETMRDLKEHGLNLEKKGNIRIVPYVYDMENALAAADLVICRAGAATLAEITTRGLPAILIPYPFASEKHQEYNAKALEDKKAAVVIKDYQLNGDTLLKVVQDLIENPDTLSQMAAASHTLGKPQAVEKITASLIQIIK